VHQPFVVAGGGTENGNGVRAIHFPPEGLFSTLPELAYEAKLRYYSPSQCGIPQESGRFQGILPLLGNKVPSSSISGGTPQTLESTPPRARIDPQNPKKWVPRPQKIPPSQGCFLGGTPPPFQAVWGQFGVETGLFGVNSGCLGSIPALFWQFQALLGGTPLKRLPD